MLLNSTGNRQGGLAHGIVVGILRAALVLTLIWAVWSIYKRVPHDNAASGAEQAASQTALQIRLRPAVEDAGAQLDVPVELMPVDVAAVQREYLSEPTGGVRFEDFLKRRMEGRKSIKANLDKSGQTTVMVAPGRWWIHTMISGTDSIEWRLPVSVNGNRQTVELRPENAYTRARSF
ncbi:MAG: hypothetical protein WCB68_07765 [Pyrinomonadaceae bacterium]